MTCRRSCQEVAIKLRDHLGRLAWVDGEVAMRTTGRRAGAHLAGCALVAFDLMRLRGRDLRGAPYEAIGPLREIIGLRPDWPAAVLS